MPDLIVGIAVLTPQNIFVCCRRQDGKQDVCHIPMRPKGAPAPQGRDGWQYEEHGDRLKCFPSLRWLGHTGEPDWFHNGYDWTVEFVRVPDGHRPDALCRLLNLKKWPTEEERRAFLTRWLSGGPDQSAEYVHGDRYPKPPDPLDE